MSLYNFFESYIEENPELISVNAASSNKYDDILTFFRQKVYYILKLE
jgi:hypothetical protein